MFTQFIRQIKKMQSIRSGVARLRAMDDHQLKDIGVTRGHILDAVRSGRI